MIAWVQKFMKCIIGAGGDYIAPYSMYQYLKLFEKQYQKINVKCPYGTSNNSNKLFTGGKFPSNSKYCHKYYPQEEVCFCKQ